jgi:hypothetical protein
MIPERSFPTLKRKATVRSNTEKAQKFMLSIMAAMVTIGKNSKSEGIIFLPRRLRRLGVLVKLKKLSQS